MSDQITHTADDSRFVDEPYAGGTWKDSLAGEH